MLPESSGDQTAAAPTAPSDVNLAATSSGSDAQITASSNGSEPAPNTGASETSSPSPKPQEPADMASAISQALDGLDGKAPPKADEPPAKDEAADPDAADQTKAAEEPKGDQDEDTTAKGEGANAPDGGAEADQLPDPTPFELAGMKPATRKRVESLLAQRREAQARVRELEPLANGYQVLRTFMSKNQLADEEMAEGIAVMADLKSGDPRRLQNFVDRVLPRLQFALEALGQAVPSDLRARVDSGEMTEEAAKEMAATRSRAAIAQQQTQIVQQERQTEQATQAQNAVRQAVLDWRTRTAASDPDFALKQDAMQVAAQAIVARNGVAKTPEQALAYAQEAYQWATQTLRSARPQPTPTRPTPNGASIASPRSGLKPAPSSFADAIGSALDAAGSR